VTPALEALYNTYPLYADLFKKQLQFVLSPSRNKAVLTGSRSGKTTAAIAYALTKLLSSPNSLGFYLALSDRSVKKIVSPIIVQMTSKHGVKYKWNGLDLVLSNGSVLSFAGANDIRKVETFRGTKLLFCIIDECASFSRELLGYLIDDILKMRLADLRGELILMGTPAKHLDGLFYDVTTGKEDSWSVCKWSIFDNPFMKEQAEEEKREYFKRKKIEEPDPTFRREFLGEWCGDDSIIMVKPPSFSTGEKYSAVDWRCVIGVDFGFKDNTAFSVIGWKRDLPIAYILECYGMPGLSVSQIALEINHLKRKYKPIRIVGDNAGCTEIIMKEFRERHRIHMSRAEKSLKSHYIEIFNDALVSESLLLFEDTTVQLQREIRKVVWNEDRSREKEGQDCDCIDASLYAYRESLHHTEKIQSSIYKASEDKLLEEAIKQAEKLASKDPSAGQFRTVARIGSQTSNLRVQRNRYG
jgi:hypothetical protein